MRIAIDIDSTLHHYWDQFSALAAAPLRRRPALRAPAHLARSRSSSPSRSAGSSRETHGATLIAAAEPYAGAVEAVNRWHAAGHFIHITSHRSADAHDATARWLDGDRPGARRPLLLDGQDRAAAARSASTC